jgi:hypothetical protein
MRLLLQDSAGPFCFSPLFSHLAWESGPCGTRNCRRLRAIAMGVWLPARSQVAYSEEE